MLSFLYRMAREFEKAHGMRPNRLYLNTEHFRQIRCSFRDPDDLSGILQTLDMEIVLDPEAIHPHVAWSPSRRRAG